MTLQGTGVLSVSKSRLTGENALRYTSLDFEDYWTIVEDDYPALRAFKGGSIAGRVKLDISWYDSKEKEFTITTEEQLWGFVLLSETHDFAGQTIKLGSDISVTEGEKWQRIGKHTDGFGNMIGQTFAGTFDGNGYTISGLYANTTGDTVGVGPFGEVTGEVQNLKLADYHIADTLVIDTADIEDNKIDSLEELWAFNLLSQYEDFAGKTITLTQNIVLNDTSAVNWTDSAASWKPIGEYYVETTNNTPQGKTFAGTFDGNNKKITGLCIKLDNTKAYNYGLFGRTTGNIQNLTLEDCYISGKANYNIGTVAGAMVGGSLTNVHVETDMNMTASIVGGLAGANEGNETAVTNCWVTGTVSGKQYVGGFFGDVIKKVSIENGINNANITGSSNRIGGFCGRAAKSTVIITNSLNTGSVTGSDRGAFIGFVNKWEATTAVSLTNVYYLTDGDLKPYTEVGDGNVVTLSNVVKLTTKRSDADISWFLDADVNGDASNPYIISDKKDLVGLVVLSKLYDFAGKTIKIADNVDAIVLNDTNKSNWADSATSWEPIGEYYVETTTNTPQGKSFAGTFEGNNKKITGLCIKLDNTKAYNYGLFGRTTGNIQNLTLEDCYISGKANYNIGTVAGAMVGGSLTNVHVETDMNMTASIVGGLAGANEGNKTTVTNCWVTGTVSGKQYVGGFFGDVIKKVSIENGINNANITGSSNRIGGFCGRAAKSTVIITNSLNTGSVTGSDRGAFIGFVNKWEATTAVSLTNAYYLTDGDLKPYTEVGDKNVVTLSNVVKLTSQRTDTDISWFFEGEGTQTNPYTLEDDADEKGYEALSNIYSFEREGNKVWRNY